MKNFTIFALLACCVGCGQATNKVGPDPNTTVGVNGGTTTREATTGKELPVFSATTSEYPSWSTLMVAAKAGLINGTKGGKYGPLETKWGVDIVLEVKDYDACVIMFGNSQCDATCLTNIDTLNPALSVACTAVCPTSTSVGGDKLITVGINSIEELKGTTVYGLEKCVSPYMFVRVLKVKGFNPADFKFENLDPAAAATRMQSASGTEKQAIDVWNPFALQTLRSNKNAKELFSSAAIPEEIIDMIVVSNAALKKPGGENFACLLCDTYYHVCKTLTSSDKKIADATLTALGEDFCKLPVDDMRIVCKETQFYSTPQDGEKLFSSDKFKETMKTVVETAPEIDILKPGQSPKIGYNDESAQLNFSTKYMKKVASSK